MIKIETVEQLLLVFLLFREAYAKGEPLRKAYRKGVRRVADQYGVTYQTIGDGCRRRLNLDRIEDLYELLSKWMEGDSEPLASQLKRSSDPSAHGLIDEQFGATSAVLIAETPEFPRDSTDMRPGHHPTDSPTSTESRGEGTASDRMGHQDASPSLTIAEAKRRLAQTFGVDPESVRITIEA